MTPARIVRSIQSFIAGKTGPPGSFRDLIRRHGDRAYNFAYRLAGNASDAADLVQEAFVRAYENRQRDESSRPFEPWVLRILRNIYFDQARRHARKRSVPLEAEAPHRESRLETLPGSDPDPADILLRQEAAGRVQQALNSLPLTRKTALVLCDIERLTYEQISLVMNCPVGTVPSRIHQGRTLLRPLLERNMQRDDLPTLASSDAGK